MNKITEIQITPIKPRDGLIGFASLVVDNQLYLSSIGIHKKLDGSGFRITYPTKKVAETNINIFHPITRDFGLFIEKAIIQKAEEIFE
jgi:stage V sporulation protein G